MKQRIYYIVKVYADGIGRVCMAVSMVSPVGSAYEA